MLQGFGAAAPMIIALIVRADRRILVALRQANATSPGKAVALQFGSPVVRWRLRRLIQVGAVHAAEADHYFLSETGWREYRSRRRIRVLVILAILVSSALLLLWGARHL